jgi:hypothetical protein
MCRIKPGLAQDHDRWLERFLPLPLGLFPRMGLHRMSWDFTIVTDAIATYDRWCAGKVVTKEL